eukprot:4961216-Prymnesium_polylepis.1
MAGGRVIRATVGRTWVGFWAGPPSKSRGRTSAGISAESRAVYLLCFGRVKLGSKLGRATSLV